MQLQLMKQEIIYPFSSSRFEDTWLIWKAYKKEQFNFRYKPIGEQVALKALGEDSGYDEELAVQMINRAMANGYRGIFPIKTNLINNGKPKSLFEQLTEARNK